MNLELGIGLAIGFVVGIAVIYASLLIAVMRTLQGKTAMHIHAAIRESHGNQPVRFLAEPPASGCAKLWGLIQLIPFIIAWAWADSQTAPGKKSKP